MPQIRVFAVSGRRDRVHLARAEEKVSSSWTRNCSVLLTRVRR